MRKTGMKKGEMIMLKKLLLSTALGVCVSQTPVQADTGSWKSLISSDRMHDAEIITVYVESDSFRLEKSVLYVRCEIGINEFFMKFHTSDFDRTEDLYELLYRLDGGPIKSQLFYSRYGNRHVKFPTIDHAIEFAKELFDRDILLVDVAYSGGMGFGFDVSGLREAIKPVREACNW